MSAGASDNDDRVTVAKGGVGSIDRAVAILNSFTSEKRRLGVTEIARMTGMPTSTVHRLLTSLHIHGLVGKQGDLYELGRNILRLATVAQSSVDVRRLAYPAMVSLRDDTGETVGLHVVVDGHRVVLDQVESRHQLRRTYSELNRPIPIPQGSAGKVLLAYSPEAFRETVCSRPLEAATSRTIVSGEELRRELDRIRMLGYAFSLEERLSGIRTLSVPVHDGRGEVVCALSVTGPATRVSVRRLHEMVPSAVGAASGLSARLGFAANDNAQIPERAQLRPR